MLKKYLKPYDFFEAKDWTEALIGGILIDVIERNSKRGKFGILKLENNNNIYEVLIWNDMYAEMETTLLDLKGKLLAISGKIKYSDYSHMNTLQSTDKTKLYKL